MKPHRFKGSGPGFECLYVEGVEQCSRMVDNVLHATLPPRPQVKLPNILAATEREQFWPGSAPSVWQAHSDMVLALLKKKDAAYGNAWQEQGYMGNLARIQSKVSRLKNILWRDDPEAGRVDPEEEVHDQYESVVDTLLDLSALCALALANLEEGNRWGK